jgi:ABC-type dipeptide/oligopeptide/nickel transport system permease component
MNEATATSVRWADKIGRRIVRYVLVLIVSLWFLHAFTFLLFFLLPSPEFGFAGWAGIDPSILEATRQRLGLSGPWYHRYFLHLGHLFHGNLGQTLTGYPVSQILESRLRASTPQWIVSLFMLIFVPVPLGMWYCHRKINGVQRFLYRLAHFGFIPQFLAAIVCDSLFIMAVAPFVPDSFTNGIRVGLAAFSGVLLPGAILFIATAATAMEIIRQPYVRSYEALGMSPSRIRLRLLWNVVRALRPLLGQIVLATVTGTIFAELLFGIPGVGHLFIESVRQQDFALMQSYLFFSGALVLAVSFAQRAP